MSCVCAQLHSIFCDLMDCNRQVPVYGIFQAAVLSGLPLPTPGDLPDPGMEPPSLVAPTLAGGFFTTSTTWEAPQVAELQPYTY